MFKPAPLALFFLAVPAVVAFGGTKVESTSEHSELAAFDPKVEPAAQIKTRQCSTGCGCGDDCTAQMMSCGASENAMACYGQVLGSFGADGTCLQKCNADFQKDLKNSMSTCVFNCYNSCNPATDWQNYCPEELQNYAGCPNTWSIEKCLPQCSELCLTCVKKCGDDRVPSETPIAPATPGCADDPTGDVAKAGATCAMLVGMGCDTDISTVDPATPEGTFVKLVCPASCDACP
mmetsp:Transcript_20241/g.40122  ORF Transcript_20241/g.40122 Transcript_20241/m.40122 type:complete len:234 (+) Transcript_20241:29-730(+)|eukprot:CAMPEP_0175139760 /NCGR_PEP_ID=MMETSP0087-20121206/11092_1 /TAXON_ID=136419 /ORGANISM="Unknown Unknown, Strain D1" /LENGTH=233 /DNA_ID=CAMNT_0016422827 /DNA_START=29 /DNA_END=730 /DNA_ORIENTATION=+